MARQSTTHAERILNFMNAKGFKSIARADKPEPCSDHLNVKRLKGFDISIPAFKSLERAGDLFNKTTIETKDANGRLRYVNCYEIKPRGAR